MLLSSQTLTALRTLDLAVIIRAVSAFATISVGIGSAGLIVRRALRGRRLEDDDPLAELVMVGALGICGYGLVLLSIGFLPVLRTVPIVAISAALAVGAWPQRSSALRLWTCAWRSARRSLCGEPVLGGACMLFVALCAAAGFRAPYATDELEYHWAAPVHWAEAGRWVTSPYRFTNGFHLAEVLYTPAAVMHSPTAAHWLHTLTFVLAAAGTGALARRIGAPGVLAASAFVAIPVAANQSSWAYNDVFASSLLIAACVAVGGLWTQRDLWTAGVLIAGACATKPLFVLLAPIVVFVALFARSAESRPRGLRRLGAMLVPLVTPGVVTAALWSVYTRWAIGAWFQTTGIVVSVFGSNERLTALIGPTIRIPTPLEALTAPFLPLATGVFGQSEPWGGRSGLVLTVFLPITLVSALLMGRGERRQMARLVIPAIVSYGIAALLIVKTRFLLPTYSVALGGIAFVVDWWRTTRRWRLDVIIIWSFRLCVLIGMADSARIQLR